MDVDDYTGKRWREFTSDENLEKRFRENEKNNSGFERADEFTYTSVGDFERHRYTKLMENDVNEVHVIAAVTVPSEFVDEKRLGVEESNGF